MVLKHYSCSLAIKKNPAGENTNRILYKENSYLFTQDNPLNEGFTVCLCFQYVNT